MGRALRGSKSLKTPGKLNRPPPQREFDKLPVQKWCPAYSGVHYRLHGIDPRTGKPWPTVYFSKRGTGRFDPPSGPGTLYVGETLAGVLMEKFDDQWGPVNSTTRSLTRRQLDEWYVSLVVVPPVLLFDATGANLSLIGTDMQLISGDYGASQEWALRLASHPYKADGIYYPSRHNAARCNLAIFKQRNWYDQLDINLLPPVSAHRGRIITANDPFVYGPPVLLRNCPELDSALVGLQVARIP